MSRKKGNKQNNAGKGTRAASQRPAIAAGASATSTDSGERSDGPAWKVLFSVVALAIVLGLASYLLKSYRLPTRVVADLIVGRVVFVLPNGNEPVAILSRPTNFRALTVEGLERVTFTPRWLEYYKSDLRASTGKWMRVPSTGELVLQGEGDKGSSLTVEGIESAKDGVGRLESLSAQPASVIAIEVVPASLPALTVKIEGHTLSPSILPVGSFELATQHASMKGFALPIVGDALSKFRAALSTNNPYLETVSRPSGLIVTLTPTAGSVVQLLEKSGAAIDSIDLATQKSTGNLETTLAGPGQITFTDYPKKKVVLLTEHDFIRFGDLANMTITTLKFDNQKQSLAMRIEGTVGQLVTKSGFLSTDHRVSGFDYIIYNAFLEYAQQLIGVFGVSLLVAWIKWHEGLHRFIRAFTRRSN